MSLEVRTIASAGVVRVDARDTESGREWFMEFWPEGARQHARELRRCAQEAEDGVRRGITEAVRAANGEASDG